MAVFGFMVVGFGVFIISNYIVDPFQQLRKASWYEVDFTTSDERMLIPGLARHYDYDSIIVGASTEENFKIDMISNILHFKKPIKFVMSGGRLYELNRALNLAFHMNKKIQNVVYTLKVPNFFVKGSDEPNQNLLAQNNDTYSFPDYLYNYNNRLLQVVTYLYNLRTLRKTLYYTFSNHHFTDQSCRSYNAMFSWICSKIYERVKHPDPQHIITIYLDPKRHDTMWEFSKNTALMLAQKI